MDELTNDLLNYAKSGNDSVKSEKLSLNQILQMVTLNLADTINSSNAKVLLPKSDFFINGRKMQIMQLFQNLVSNGLKYQNGRELPCVTIDACLLYTSPSPRDRTRSRMPSSA